MKLNKDQFCKAIKTYKQMLEEEDQIFQTLDISSDWKCSEWITNYYKLFREILEDIENPRVIEEVDWFIFETDFGSRNTERKNYNSEEKNLSYISTPEKLYDFIVSNGN